MEGVGANCELHPLIYTSLGVDLVQYIVCRKSRFNGLAREIISLLSVVKPASY
jgi:hypothetical protein